jgi:hypothetical protein
VERDSSPCSQGGELRKLVCYIRFAALTYWHSRTRQLISEAETYSYPAFRQSFRDLRRKSRRAEFELMLALLRFEKEMERRASDATEG